MSVFVFKDICVPPNRGTNFPELDIPGSSLDVSLKPYTLVEGARLKDTEMLVGIWYGKSPCTTSAANII